MVWIPPLSTPSPSNTHTHTHSPYVPISHFRWQPWLWLSFNTNGWLSRWLYTQDMQSTHFTVCKKHYTTFSPTAINTHILDPFPRHYILFWNVIDLLHAGHAAENWFQRVLRTHSLMMAANYSSPRRKEERAGIIQSHMGTERFFGDSDLHLQPLSHKVQGFYWYLFTLVLGSSFFPTEYRSLKTKYVN